jgi:hypothetical protein
MLYLKLYTYRTELQLVREVINGSPKFVDLLFVYQLFLPLFLFCLFFCGARTLHMLSKCSVTELHPQSYYYVIL